MKAKANLYRGIEYVVIDELPVLQQKLIAKNNGIERIKIMVDGHIKSNCVQYAPYELWFSSVYKVEKEKLASPDIQQPEIFTPQVLVTKA